jgi:multisubunit Na+/H+ antiporter MnhB subunit
LRLGIDKFITKRIVRKKEPSISSENNDTKSSTPIPRRSWIIIILGIIVAAIGFAGTIFYGSQFVKEEVNAGGALPYTVPSQIKNVSPIDLEIVFVVIGVIGFGIFTYGFATKVDKPLDFYPV